MVTQTEVLQKLNRKQWRSTSELMKDLGGQRDALTRILKQLLKFDFIVSKKTLTKGGGNYLQYWRRK